MEENKYKMGKMLLSILLFPFFPIFYSILTILLAIEISIDYKMVVVNFELLLLDRHGDPFLADPGLGRLFFYRIEVFQSFSPICVINFEPITDIRILNVRGNVYYTTEDGCEKSTTMQFSLVDNTVSSYLALPNLFINSKEGIRMKISVTYENGSG